MNKLERFRQKSAELDALYSDVVEKKRAALDAVYVTVAQKKGRLRIGPSNKDGLYITSQEVTGETPTNVVTISHVTKEEAAFIVKMLTDIYEL